MVYTISNVLFICLFGYNLFFDDYREDRPVWLTTLMWFGLIISVFSLALCVFEILYL